MGWGSISQRQMDDGCGGGGIGWDQSKAEGCWWWWRDGISQRQRVDVGGMGSVRGSCGGGIS